MKNKNSVRNLETSEFTELESIMPPLMYGALIKFLKKSISPDFRRLAIMVENRRSEMKRSDRLLAGVAPAGGYLEGQVVEMVPSGKRALSEVVKASKRPIWCRLLYTLTKNYKAKSVLELGTCVGISTSYLAGGAKSSGTVYTLEGSHDFAAVAQENLQALNLSNYVKVFAGLFDDTLEAVLKNNSSWDIVFIDGHHDGDATIRYFKTIKEHLSENAFVIFDDIRWSSDMTRAWKEIIEVSGASLFVDFDEMGLCAFFPSEEQWITYINAKDLKSDICV